MFDFKIHAKKIKIQKKAQQIRKIFMQKRSKIRFQKSMQKKPLGVYMQIVPFTKILKKPLKMKLEKGLPGRRLAIGSPSIVFWLDKIGS